jgi:hypothetical protein
MKTLGRYFLLVAVVVLASAVVDQPSDPASAAEKKKPRKPMVDEKLVLQSMCSQLAREAKARDDAEAKMSDSDRKKAQAAREELAKKKADELRKELQDTQKAQVAAARKRQREQSKALLAEVATLRKAIERLESGELEVVSLPKSDFAPDGTWIVDRAALIELGADYAANFDGLGNRIARDGGKKR